MMREMKPRLNRVAVLANATDPFTKPMLEQLHSGAQALRLELLVTQVRGADEYEAVFAAWVKQGAEAVFVQPSLPVPPAVVLAMRHRMPSFSFNRRVIEAGGLLAYAADAKDLHRVAAHYVDKILKGAKPADLPVQQPTKFTLVINAKTAKALGMTIPQTMLLRGPELVE